jgi:hypothetical protein
MIRPERVGSFVKQQVDPGDEFGSVVGRDGWPGRHLVDDLVRLRLRSAPAYPNAFHGCLRLEETEAGSEIRGQGI